MFPLHNLGLKLIEDNEGDPDNDSGWMFVEPSPSGIETDIYSPFLTSYKLTKIVSPDGIYLLFEIKFNLDYFKYPKNNIPGHNHPCPNSIKILLRAIDNEKLNRYLTSFHEKNKETILLQAAKLKTLGAENPSLFINKITSTRTIAPYTKATPFHFASRQGDKIHDEKNEDRIFSYVIGINLCAEVKRRLYSFTFNTKEFFQRFFDFDKLHGKDKNSSLPFIKRTVSAANESLNLPIEIYFINDSFQVLPPAHPKFDIEGGLTNVIISNIPVLSDEINLPDTLFRCSIEDKNDERELFTIKMRRETKANFHLAFLDSDVEDATDIRPTNDNLIALNTSEHRISSKQIFEVTNLNIKEGKYKYKFVLIIEVHRGEGLTSYLGHLSFYGIHGLTELLRNVNENLLSMLLESEEWFNGTTILGGDVYKNYDLCHLLGLINTIKKGDIKHNDIINMDSLNSFANKLSYYTTELWDKIERFESTENYRLILENINSTNPYPYLVNAWTNYQALIFQSQVGARYLEKMQKDISSTSTNAVRNNLAWEAILSNLPKYVSNGAYNNELRMDNGGFIIISTSIAVTKCVYKFADIPELLDQKSLDEILLFDWKDNPKLRAVKNYKDLAFLKYADKVATYSKSALGVVNGGLDIKSGKFAKGSVDVLKALVDLPETKSGIEHLFPKYSDKVLSGAKIGLSAISNGFKITKYLDDLEDAHARRNYEIEGYLYAAIMFSVADTVATTLSELPIPHTKAIGISLKFVTELSLLYLNTRISEEKRSDIEILLQSTCFGYYYSDPVKNKYPSIKGKAKRQISFLNSVLAPVQHQLTFFDNKSPDPEKFEFLMKLKLEFTPDTISEQSWIYIFFLNRDGMVLPDVSRKIRLTTLNSPQLGFVNGSTNNIKFDSGSDDVHKIDLAFDFPMKIVKTDPLPGGSGIGFREIEIEFGSIEIMATMHGTPESFFSNDVDIFNQFLTLRKIIKMPDQRFSLSANPS